MAETNLATNHPVLVTGATGYIATHIVEQLLAKGYRVRGTVRSIEPSKVSHLTSLPNASSHLELVVADLLGENAFDESVKGCEFIMHTASPYVVNVRNPQKELVEPAVNGTLSVLKSCQKYMQSEQQKGEGEEKVLIKKVILTSSMAAVTDEPDTSHVYTEADWNEKSNLKRNPYYFSKVEAEKAAWKFVESLSAADKFALVVINPYMVIGPSHSPSLNTSPQVFADIASGKFPAIVSLSMGLVDVRDVAKSHVLAMEKPNSNGRNICTACTMHMRDIVQTIRSAGYNYPKLPSADLACAAGDVMTKMFSYFQPTGTGQYIRTHLGRVANCDSSKMLRELEMEFRPMEESIEDTMADLVKWKHLPPPPAGKL